MMLSMIGFVPDWYFNPEQGPTAPWLGPPMVPMPAASPGFSGFGNGDAPTVAPQTVATADGTPISVASDGTMTAPDGTQVGTMSTDGTITTTDGTTIAPDGTTTAPDGTVTAPDGTTISPAGAAAPTAMAVAQPVSSALPAALPASPALSSEIDGFLLGTPNPQIDDVVSFLKLYRGEDRLCAAQALIARGLNPHMVVSALRHLGWTGAIPQMLFGFLSLLVAAANGFHGVRRNHGSVGWGVWWFVMGGMFPVLTSIVAVGQGYAKPRPIG
jgi:hypothetical protein